MVLNIIFIETRNLLPAADPTKSVVSGTGISNFIAGDDVTITVQAKYSNGSLKTAGGDIFIAKITNRCLKTNQFGCFAVGGQVQVIPAEVHEQMTDHGNGTYSYTWTIQIDGTVTVTVYLLTSNGAYYDFFQNTNFDGPPSSTGIVNNINYDWTGGTVMSGIGDCLTFRYYTYVQGPVNGATTFGCDADDDGFLILNGVNILSCPYIIYTTQRTTGLNKWYELRLDFREYVINAHVKLYWAYGSQPLAIIPSSALSYPTYVSGTPVDVTVSCPFGFRGRPTYTDKCRPI